MDSVNSVLALNGDNISPSPDIDGGVGADHILGVARLGKNLIIILDIEKTLSVSDMAAIRSQSQTRKVA